MLDYHPTKYILCKDFEQKYYHSEVSMCYTCICMYMYTYVYIIHRISVHFYWYNDWLGLFTCVMMMS